MEIIGDPLRDMARTLEISVATGIYDRAAWHKLLKTFEDQGRTSGAAAIRARIAHFEKLVQVPA